MSPASTIMTAVLLGLAAHGGTAVILALVPASWRNVKPVACALCMSWWTSLIGASVWFTCATPAPWTIARGAVFGTVVVAATGVGRFLTKLDGRFLGPEVKAPREVTVADAPKLEE